MFHPLFLTLLRSNGTSSPSPLCSSSDQISLCNINAFSEVVRTKDMMTQHEFRWQVNTLRRNNDLNQTSHCHIKGLSVKEVMRIENTITQVKFF